VSETVDANVMDVKLIDVLNSFKKWFKVLSKKWWLFVIMGLIGGLIGSWYAGKQKALYESQMTFSLEEGSEGGMGGAFSLAAEFGFNLGSSSGAFSGDNIVSIITSRKMVEQTLLFVDTLNGKPVTIADQYLEIFGFKKGFEKDLRLKNINFPPGLPRDKFTYLQDSLLFLMYHNILKVALIAGKPNKKLNQYEIKMKTTDERFSKIFPEILIKQTITFYTELRSKKSRETLEILEERVASLKGSLNSSIGARAATQDANINPAFSAAQAPLQRKDAEIRVYGSAYGELFKNLELARYSYLKNMPLLQIIDEPKYPLLKTKLGRLKTAVVGSLIMGFLTVVILFIAVPFFQKEKTVISI